jgi:electron transfer flavoprotein alpha subunit
MTSLVYADLIDGQLSDTTAKVVSAALKIDSTVHVLIAGDQTKSAAEQAALIQGVSKIICAEHISFSHDIAEHIAPLLVQLAPAYDTLLASCSTTAKNIMPRVAALLDVMQISDIIDVIDATTFTRPIYAGNALQTLSSRDSKRVITVRTTAFAASASHASPCVIEHINVAPASVRVTFESHQQSKLDRPQLTSAKIIISGGRALQSAAHFKEFIEPVADRLGAAIGASRAAVDAGYAPNDWQVGQTGKVVAPDLYIAVGISGAIQHLAGMKDSKVIVAINKDEEAPIFGVADYGLVADLFDALPALAKEIS